MFCYRKGFPETPETPPLYALVHDIMSMTLVIYYGIKQLIMFEYHTTSALTTYVIQISQALSQEPPSQLLHLFQDQFTGIPTWYIFQ